MPVFAYNGDAAQSGKPEEYAEVTDFLGALLGEIDPKGDRLFVVPGNHDIDRHARKKVWESMRIRLAVTPDLLGVSRRTNCATRTWFPPGSTIGCPYNFPDGTPRFTSSAWTPRGCAVTTRMPGGCS